MPGHERYKDLVDLVAIASGASVEAAAQRRALSSEAGRRVLDLPGRLGAPDRAAWEPTTPPKPAVPYWTRVRRLGLVDQLQRP
jgi:hypothetical protein